MEAPKVLGTPPVNEVLTCYEGTWEGSAPLTYKFQWLRDGTNITLARAARTRSNRAMKATNSRAA